MNMKKFFRGFIFAAAFLLAFFYTALNLLPLPGHVPILMYHFFGSAEDAEREKNFVSRQSFQRQMEFLKRFGYRVISLDQLYAIKTGKRKPRGKEIVITIDDGNYTFATEALPILKSYRYPVTLFLVSENVKGGLHGSMSEGTVRSFIRHPWVKLGAHSKTHPVLSELSEDQMREEIAGSKRDLEAMFGQTLYHFAYPSGILDERSVKIAEEVGYRMAFTTAYKKLGEMPEGLLATTRVKITRSSDLALVFWYYVSGLHQWIKKVIWQIKTRLHPAHESISEPRKTTLTY